MTSGLPIGMGAAEQRKIPPSETSAVVETRCTELPKTCQSAASLHPSRSWLRRQGRRLTGRRRRCRIRIGPSDRGADHRANFTARAYWSTSTIGRYFGCSVLGDGGSQVIAITWNPAGAFVCTVTVRLATSPF